MSSVTQFPVQDVETIPDSGFFPGSSDGDALSLRRLLSILRRRKTMIMGVVAVFTTACWLVVNQITPIFSASAQIVLAPNRQQVVDIESVVSGITPDYYTNETEAAVIASRELATKAVDQLDLTRNPLFNPLLRRPEPGLLDRLVGSVKQTARTWLAPADESGGVTEAAAPEASETHPLMRLPEADRAIYLRELATGAYLGSLIVTPSPRSRVITVSFQSTDPELAAGAANTTAELYIQGQVSDRGEATSRAVEFLAKRVDELRDRVVAQERAIARFRADSGIVDTGGITLYQKQISDLDERLLTARQQRSEAEALYNQIKDLLASGDGLESSAAVLDSDLISRLREQEAEIIRKLSELTTTLRPGHPRLQLASNELADLRAAIKREADKVASKLGNEVQIARVREANTSRELARVQNVLDGQNEAQATLQSMVSELAANKQLYETFLERLKETDILEDADPQADAFIISRATVPGGPIYPNKQLMLAAAISISAVLGVALAFFLEFLDSGFRSTTQLETFSGVSCLGMVPALKRRRNDLLPHQTALSRPNSTYGEAIRSLRTGFMLSSADRAPRSLLLTSSVPSEGKTSTALSIAATAAKSGQRTIIIDCDLRHPNLHINLNASNAKGLSEYLSGHLGLDDVIEIDPDSSVHYITAGARTSNPTDLLGSDAMRGLIRRLCNDYELVILDTPPLLAVSDALVLVREVDRTIFVIRWEKTRRETAMAGLKQALEAGARVAGTVLTRVDVRKHSQYDYADSGYYYYGSYRKYYTD
jgi:capsular exopolysaccharide synthesis family protein